MPSKNALRGKRSLDHMLRLIRQHGLTIDQIATRYTRSPEAIGVYLHSHGYDTFGNRLPKPRDTRPRGKYKLSAGGSAGYVAASNHDEAHIPLEPVRYHNAPRRTTTIDWNANRSPVEPAALSRPPTRIKPAKPAKRERPGPVPRFTPEEDQQIRAKYETGATAYALAREYSCADVTIANAVRRAGGVTRGRQRYSKSQHERFEEAS